MTKRGMDGMDMQTYLQTNGHDNNNQDAKRLKMDGKVGPPSKVVHIRNIPNEVTEAEIIHLGIPFGRVTNVLVLKGKNQAFLEMEEESAAVAMVNYFTNCVAQLRDRSVYVQFSTHTALKTDQTHSNASASAQAALQAAQALSGMPEGKEVTGGANTVLRVIVEHMVYPVTLDVIHQIFSRVGKVMKIVTFTKNNTFQALIQYPDVITAQAAKLSLDGQNIYNACCTLRIEYSKLSNLNVKFNNDKSRDYMNPSLPTGDPTLDLSHSTALATQSLVGPGFLSGMLGSPFGHMGLAGLAAGQFGAGMPGLGLPGMGYPYPSAQALAQVGVRMPGMVGPAGCVLLISGLNEVDTEPDHLFMLFGVYGDVLRVKILFNKKDTALIQMSEPQQAMLAITNLDKVKLLGKQIRVLHSKHTTVQVKNIFNTIWILTNFKFIVIHNFNKDCPKNSNGGSHRYRSALFKKPGSKNYQNIYPPSATLHLSNIPATVEEEDLRTAFTSIDIEVQAFRFFPKDRKMALAQLGCVEDAVNALVKLHNFQLSETSHLRVSFSKSTI
ncbi:polypyrimidine tract-binding protein 1 [Eurytemora carolleeae]|uniref:polypyrimidine tract-binding protein 1 n=1 Tax=Eurytemora carolleeae TaxID=1294199 RepID=UPI000C77EBB7|nr:polypyrimidine tract-binding protein 1 [Eurytemora carolleeae]|eukprot:XP_023326580.1 polypyrimidine tract-binding protein 1-like [Eurytemora affinis]